MLQGQGGNCILHVLGLVCGRNIASTFLGSYHLVSECYANMISIATSKKEQFLVPRVLQKAHLALGQASGVSQQLQEANKEDPRGCHGSLTVVAAVVSLDLGLPLSSPSGCVTVGFGGFDFIFAK